LLKFVENAHPGVLQAIREKKTLTDEITAELNQVLSDFKDMWKERASAATPLATGASAQAPATAGA
jgi:hypothetical protein